MFGKMKTDLQICWRKLKEKGLYKNERILTTPQGASIRVSTGQTVLNFCAITILD
jgi:glycine C-acetyltransferase